MLMVTLSEHHVIDFDHGIIAVIMERSFVNHTVQLYACVSVNTPL